MSPQEALEHLQGFLDTERTALELIKPAAAKKGIVIDYSLASLGDFLRWILPSIEIVRVPIPDTEPTWIRAFHANGLIEFQGDSKYLVLRAAYYLRESFVRASGPLSWTVGRAEYIEKNMPVITGFQHKIEMAPLMICENLFSGILGDGEPDNAIDLMIDAWVKFMPRYDLHEG